jgi:hypothetical protein
VRQLNSSLGTISSNEEIFAWIIIDFCIHPLVHQNQIPEEEPQVVS